MENSSIFSYIKSEEAAYKLPSPIQDDWEWVMPEFIKQCFFYKNGRLLTGNADDKPVKNIVLYLRNLQDWAEDIDVKNINIYVNNKYKQHLSFLIKKYHDDIFLKENDLDTFIDEGKETKNDYGGVLVKNLNKIRPEVVPWQSIAFCDQTDIMSGAIGIKHFYSTDQLKGMAEFGWGDEKNGATISIDDLLLLSKNYKDKDSQKVRTPSKYTEIYEVHGSFPESWLTDGGDEEKYVKQMQIVGYYTDESGKQTGVCLFRAKETEEPFKFFSRDKINFRALGRSAIEEVFEDQVWTNYSQKRKMDMLDSASKTIIKTTDGTLTAKHPSGLKDLDNLEIIKIEEGKDAGILDTFPRNIQLFTQTMNELEEHAKQTAGATDAMLGMNPQSGTPFRLQNLVVNQGQGLHNGRRKKYARFIEQIYRDWIIPYIAKQIVKGVEFISKLSPDELEFVLERVSANQANKQRLEEVLNGKIPTDFAILKEQIKTDWKQKGNTLPLAILKDELKGVELDIEINVAGATTDSVEMVDKLSGIFRQIIANPQAFQQAMQIPMAAKAFSKMIEMSGLSSPDFDIPATPSIPTLPPNPALATT